MSYLWDIIKRLPAWLVACGALIIGALFSRVWRRTSSLSSNPLPPKSEEQYDRERERIRHHKDEQLKEIDSKYEEQRDKWSDHFGHGS